MGGATFTWRIENFPALIVKTEKFKSETFVMYGHEWNIWVQRKSSQGSHLGLFLSAANSMTCSTQRWNIPANFCIAVVNRVEDSKTLRKYSTPECCFCDRTSKWGWDDFVHLRKLYEISGFLVDGTLIVEAQVTVKANLSGTQQIPVQDFPPFRQGIGKAVEATCSSAGPSQYWPHSSCPRPQKPISLGSKLLLDLPQALASGLPGFCTKFKELYEPYASNVAVLEATQSFFESKDDTLSSLEKMDAASKKIKESMEEVSKEIEEVERPLRKLKDAKARLLQEYAAIGKKCQRLKAEWDEIAAKIPDMTEKRETAEKELAEIHNKLNNFIHLLKTAKFMAPCF